MSSRSMLKVEFVQRYIPFGTAAGNRSMPVYDAPFILLLSKIIRECVGYGIRQTNLSLSSQISSKIYKWFSNILSACRWIAASIWETKKWALFRPIWNVILFVTLFFSLSTGQLSTIREYLSAQIPVAVALAGTRDSTYNKNRNLRFDIIAERSYTWQYFRTLLSHFPCAQTQ